MNFDPNPLYFKMVEIYSQNKTKENKVIIGNEGGTRCFSGKTKVLTKNGYKQIKDINSGEEVLTYNEFLGVKEYKVVKEKFRFKNTKRTFKITLKNDKTITSTEDHEFYYEGGWVCLKNLLSLLDGKRNMETDT